MTVTRESLSQPPQPKPIEQTTIQLKEPVVRLKTYQVDRILASPNFKSGYRRSKAFQNKYDLAYGLIDDGRYSDYSFLLNHFIPDKDILEEQSLETQQELKKEGKEYKDSLTILLMQKGLLDPDSKDAKEASGEVGKMVDRDELLSKLKDALPIHVMGAITNALLFDSISDEEKREKLRGWTTKALLRPYLGDLAVQRISSDLDFRTLVDLIPEKIFQNIDTATMQIARYYFTNQAMRMFTEGEDEGFSRLEAVIQDEKSLAKREFMEGVKGDFEEVRNTSIPEVFKPFIETWADEQSQFPHFRQKYFVHEFLKTKRKLLNGDTGGGKTASAFLAMEAAGAEKVTIFGPAKARNTWPREADKIFQEATKPDVFAIRSAKDLDNERVTTASYVYISSELMGYAWKNPELYNKIKTSLVDKRQTDGIVLDESDEFRNQGAGCSKMLMDLAREMRENHGKDQLTEMPMVALTATPITSSLADLDITMSLLYPERFALPRTHELDKFPFSIQAYKDPEIAYSLLFGEKLMIQWSLEDMYGERAERFELNPNLRRKLEISPSESIIYQWVAGLPLGPLAKTRLLRSTLLNPELIKNTLRKRNLLPEQNRPLDDLLSHLNKLHSSWMQWMLEKNSNIADEKFSADWIAKFDPNFFLECFFDDRLIDGIEGLASRSPYIKDDWQKREAVSTKYKYAREVMEGAVTKDTSGYHPTEKAFFVSPYHRRGITRFIDDEHITDADLEDNAWSFYEHIFTEWFPDLPRDMAVNIDGTRSFAFRDRHGRIWREEGDRDIFVVASQDSVNESMDWAARNTPGNKNINKVKAIWFGWPYSWEEFKQMGGRFYRPGLAKTMDLEVLEAENTIDQGFYDLVRRKYLLSQIALAGIKLDTDDLEFFRSSSEAKRILEAQPNVGQVFLQDVIGKLKGRGEAEGIEKLSQEKNGKTFFELFAEFYFDEGRDEFRIVGNNSELIKNIALQSEPRRVISVGAGSCLFARKLVEAGFAGEIDNIDINGAALRLAKERFPSIGNIKVEGASSLKSTDSEAYDLADYSFILPWTKLYDSHRNGNNLNVNDIERVKVLTEMNRVLRIGGKALLSFPESSFDNESFAAFARTLTTHFGFSLKDPSGLSYATDLQPNKRIGWIISLQKVNTPSLSGLNSYDLAFQNEGNTINTYKPKKEVSPTIVRVEYPIFSSRQFDVFNPLTNQTLNANSTSRLEGTFYISLTNLVSTIKEDLTSEQYKLWNIVRREVGERLNRSYTDSEEILAGILTRKGLDKMLEWDETSLRRIVTSEIRRMQRRN